jgi:hypothetical protein
MEQRRLRLGDILDDYCPRERRVTNHAVVAIVEQDVKQTRCTTCDAEHVYKGGKAPRRKKADSTSALYKEVLAGIEEPTRPVPMAASLESDAMTERDDDASDLIESEDLMDDPTEDDDSQVHLLPPDEGPVHRPLIRAQLPRTEGMKIERQAPEFTIRQNTGRPGAFRGRGASGPGGGNGNGQGNGNGGQRFGRGPHRGNGGGGGRGPGGGGQGFGRGPGGGGGNQQRHGGPRKRSR